MDLKCAKMCMDCEVIFDGRWCPKCGRDTAWEWLRRWVRPLRGEVVGVKMKTGSWRKRAWIGS